MTRVRARSVRLMSAVLFCAVSAAQSQTIPARSSSLQLIVNVPAARLDVWQEGNWRKSYRVAVGAPRYPTPLGDFQLDAITWNPWWIPPPSEWARNEKAQPPGERNPMGRVKLAFGGFYYLHGTADTRSMGRAASHGCIRLRNDDALELARTVLYDANAFVSTLLIDSLVADPARTQRVALDCTVSLSIRYDLAEVRDTTLIIYADVYRRAPDLRTEILAALARAGLTSGDLDMAQVERLVQRGPRAQAVPLRSLVRVEVWRRLPRVSNPL